MKIDIENKILIPFIVLIVLSILTMSVVSYYNTYSMLVNNEIENRKKDLAEVIFLINSKDNEINNQAESQKYIVNYYENSDIKNFVIANSNEILLSTSYIKKDWTDNLIADTSQDSRVINGEEYIFIYERYDKYNWVAGYFLNKSELHNEVLPSLKNIILVAIISLIFSMEASILIAYNISKPIKTLAKHCDNIIDQDSYQENIVIKRNDEIGILSNAFNNMLGRIKSNIEKITEVTKFNEDILKSIPAGIITTDKYGRLLSINDTAKKLMHENKKQNVDLDILEKLLEQLKKTIKSNKTINEVLEFNDLEGNTIYLDITTSLFIGNENKINGAICNFYDISERKRFENNMDIVDRLTTLGQFAAGISHEIRNPLTGMKTSIQVLKNRLLKDDNATNEKLFDGVIHEIDRINNLITGLLNFAKPKAPNYEKTDLVEVINRTLTLVNKTAKENNIGIMVNSMSKTNIILSDKAQIEQIFLNIIKNSIAAIGTKGHIEILFNKLNYEKGNYVAIEFIDDGCGIDSKDIDKIFNPFFTKSSTGTGLGLSVVYELVKGNQGTINIQSKINEGTKVTLEFPAYGGNDE